MSGAPDFFYKEAQRLGYVARAAFKLLQIQKQHKIITPGSSVLDLGCAPGAWLQVACQSLGPIDNGGVVVGIDIKNVNVPKLYCDARVKTVCADIMDFPTDKIRALSPQGSFNAILSDMCPRVSGITDTDSALSVELGMRALEIAIGSSALARTEDDCEDSVIISPNRKEDEDNSNNTDVGLLQTGGNLIIKLLESEDTKEFARICKPLFVKSSRLRPKATRPSSREFYLICQGRIRPSSKV